MSLERCPTAVVIVDDEVDHAFIMRHVLSALAPGLRVEVVNDPRTMAEHLALAPHGALVLADRLLEGRDSLCLLQPVLRQRPDLAFALLSAAISDEDRDRALGAGAIEAAQKPGSLDGWRSLLSQLITRPLSA